jgi:biopolymer transport protein ExbB
MSASPVPAGSDASGQNSPVLGTESGASSYPGRGRQQVATGSGTLPRDLSPWGMFLAADIVVQIVMAGLALASLATWTVFAAKLMEIAGERRRSRSAQSALADATNFADARRGLEAAGSVAAALARAADEELQSADGLPPEGVKERVTLSTSEVTATAVRRLRRGTGALATIGAIAPFVGLFGTVWGIMNAFIGISRSQTTNLAVVAPGIAEALLATALGLAVAIPAVVIYNAVSRAIAGQRAALDGVSVHILRLVSRDLDRGEPAHDRIVRRPGERLTAVSPH